VSPAPDAWTSVRVHDISNREAVVAALFGLGAEGVQDFDDAVVTHLRRVRESEILARLKDVDPTARVELADTPNVDWSAEWKSRITSHRLGVLVVTPPWLARSFTPAERIVIEPGMAFGTGEHETTRSVLRLLQRVIRAGDYVADLGAGSAVLAIGAAKLGASRVVGIEIDPDAIENAESNLDLNDVVDRVTIIEGDAAALLPLVAPVRVVVANIISGVLLELLPIIRNALTSDGVAVLSGILLDERPLMEQSFRAAHWTAVASETEGAWWSAAIRPK
jgi:ribosomal protein L11 methyltransferase